MRRLRDVAWKGTSGHTVSIFTAPVTSSSLRGAACTHLAPHSLLLALIGIGVYVRRPVEHDHRCGRRGRGGADEDLCVRPGEGRGGGVTRGQLRLDS